MNTQFETTAKAVFPPPLEIVPLTDEAEQTHTKRAELQVALSESFAGWLRTINAMVSAFPGYTVQPVFGNMQAYIDQANIRRLDPIEERMRKATVDRVLNSTVWLTSREVGELSGQPAKNVHAAANRLLQQGRVFAIKRRGQFEFPRYAFDELGEPAQGLAEILKAFDGYTPMRIASWFESTNSLLDGRRPREVLVESPNAVLQAAKAHRAGTLHG